MKHLIKFMMSYAAMLGTFCVIFFTFRLPVGEFNASVFGCIMSVCALLLSKIAMLEIEQKINLKK